MAPKSRPGHCFIDLDLNNHRSELALTAAFVNATDTRYGFSSKDLRRLGGTEISRIPGLISTDHEWQGRASSSVKTRPPVSGNRIVIALDWSSCPLTCENFSALCSNGTPSARKEFGKPAVGECGKPLTYLNCPVHRIIPDSLFQGGDFVFGNGSGGESIFGKKFKDERAGLNLKHDGAGVVSMGNSGKNSNTSQFFITLGEKGLPQCDGKHAVFGRVVSGFEVMKAVGALGSPSGAPKGPVSITACGHYAPLETPSAGYWFDQPDLDSYQGFTPVFMTRPRVAVIAPSGSVLEKFRDALGSAVTVTNGILTEEGGSEATKVIILELLELFKIDVVLIAPVCRDCSPTVLPTFWQLQGLELGGVVIVAKPLQSLELIWKHSWVRNKSDWTLEGVY